MSDDSKVITELIELEPLLQPVPEVPAEPVVHEVHFQYWDKVRLTVPSLAKFYNDRNEFFVCAYSAYGPAADQVSYEIVHADVLSPGAAKIKETRINVLAKEIEKIEE